MPRIAGPDHGQRQLVARKPRRQVEWHERDPAHSQSRGPTGYDRQSDSGCDQAHDRLFFLGDLGHACGVAGLKEKLHREVMTMGSRTAVRNDERLIGHVLDGQYGARGQRVGIRYRNNGGLVEQEPEGQPWVGGIGGANDGRVEPARQQAGQEANGLLLEQLDVDLGMGLAEMWQKLGHQPGCGTVDRADPEDGCIALPVSLELGLQAVGSLHDVTSRLDKDLSGIRQRYVPRGTGKQPGAQPVLEELDLAAERCRQHVHLLRRFPEMEGVCDGNQAFELSEFHTGPDYCENLYDQCIVAGASSSCDCAAMRWLAVSGYR